MKCYIPMSVPRPNGSGGADRITVPCGGCVNCLKNKSLEWAFRLEQELKISDSNYYISLTYCDKYINTKTVNGWTKQTLKKTDLQNFFRRVRKNNSQAIKYFGIGEYGGESLRPHYHAIMFNVDNRIDIQTAWTKRTGEFTGQREIYDLIGSVDIQEVNRRAINYVTNYLVGQNFTFGKYDDKDVEHPFRIMSKGIGEHYVTENWDWHKKHKRFYVEDERQNKINIPRYYKDKIFNKPERALYAIEANNRFLENTSQERMLTESIRHIRDTKNYNRSSKKAKL